jgi:hypothetical protein
MDYAVYVSVPAADEVDGVAKAAARLDPEGREFAVFERDEASQPTDVQLGFRITGAGSGEEAVLRALDANSRCRAEAGFPPDDLARASLGIWPGAQA